jgi:hypothetical protein
MVPLSLIQEARVSTPLGLFIFLLISYTPKTNFGLLMHHFLLSAVQSLRSVNSMQV